ncbi:MAG: signal peptidase I, partial [Candidatus Eremiobacterota bacterium]
MSEKIKKELEEQEENIKEEKKEEELKEETPVRISFFVGAGYSMNPTIQVGDILQIEETSIKNIKKGDIVVFQNLTNPGQYIMHRVTSINKNGSLVTKGDNNQQEDTIPVDDTNLIGKIVEAKRPARIQRYVLHNQYDKASRELTESIIQQNEQEKQSLQIALDDAQLAMEVSPEYIAYKESPLREAYEQAMMNLEAVFTEEIPVEDGENGEDVTAEKPETPEQIAMEEAWQALQDSAEYKAYVTSSAYLEAQSALVNRQQWEPVKIIEDSETTREEFPNVEAFPAAVLDIPELITEGAKIKPGEKKYCNRVENLTAIASFEAE